MSTYGLVQAGIRAGVVELIPSPEGDGEHDTCCRIGDGWFYFGGQEAEDSTPEEMWQNVGRKFIAEEITEALEYSIKVIDYGEYEYYIAVLEEAYENEARHANHRARALQADSTKEERE